MKKLAIVFILLILILQYNIWFSAGGVRSIEQLEQNIAEQKKENEQLRAQNKQLRGEIEALRNNPELLEEIAREKLGLIKPNEKFYRIIPEENQ